MRVLISDPAAPFDRVLRRAIEAEGHTVVSGGGGGGGAEIDVVIVSMLGLITAGAPVEDGGASGISTRLRNAHDRGARRAIVLSGIDAVGPRPLGEGFAFEGSPPHPVDAVGAALLAAELEAIECVNALGITLVILRAGHVYDDGNPGCLQPLVEALACGTAAELETLLRDRVPVPTHVDDVARAAALAVEKGDWIYHVTDPPPTAAEIVRALVEADHRLNRPWLEPVLRRGRSWIRFPYPPHRAACELGFVPRWDVVRGARAALGREVDRVGRFDPAQAGSDVFEQEARFWDQEGRAEREMSLRPHDWGLDLELGNAIQAPTYRFMKKILERHRPATVLDLGCGSGVFSRYMARYGGIRGTGIDLSSVKIEKARDLARAQGVAHLVDYRVANALEYAAPERVDLICALGSLHHLPDIERNLPAIIERNLKPGGFILAVEPFYEGYHPAFLRLMSWIANSRLRRFFEVDRYEEIAGAAERGQTIFGESPAGLVHHHGSCTLDQYLRSAFEPIAIRYAQFLTPFFANALVVFQRSKGVARVARRLVPAVVRLDSFLCRFRRWSRWAAVGLYAVRPRRP